MQQDHITSDKTQSEKKSPEMQNHKSQSKQSENANVVDPTPTLAKLSL